MGTILTRVNALDSFNAFDILFSLWRPYYNTQVTVERTH